MKRIGRVVAAGLGIVLAMSGMASATCYLNCPTVRPKVPVLHQRLVPHPPTERLLDRPKTTTTPSQTGQSDHAAPLPVPPQRQK